jgi:hypothetical protein
VLLVSPKSIALRFDLRPRGFEKGFKPLPTALGGIVPPQAAVCETCANRLGVSERSREVDVPILPQLIDCHLEHPFTMSPNDSKPNIG